ncbi:MAG: TIGR01777 family protein [Candidatus Omnitrophica bacterium]|nr:TIGR01777 family protein [Candidatus Omnitrophota bacterium]
MKIAISGSHGLIGRYLFDTLHQEHHQVFRLQRSKAASYDESISSIYWDPLTGSAAAERLEGCDVVIHLAGANIASKRWNASVKKDIFTSRVDATRALVQILLRLRPPPKLFICASAIGFYGAGSQVDVTETSSCGKGFLAELCSAWENSAALLSDKAGVRVVNLRFGPVLSLDGGILAQMLPVFRIGLGGPVGLGSQYINWISLREISSIINFICQHPEITGPVNCVSPGAVTNASFSLTLAGILRRTCFLPTPAWLVRLLFGEMADELILHSPRVLPSRLLDSGYVFQEPYLAEALTRMLK